MFVLESVQTLRKQSNPTMKQTSQNTGNYNPVCFASIKSVLFVTKG
jgi:hypothetical protein